MLCFILFSFLGPHVKSRESKRKEDFSIKPRSPVGANPVTSSRFTVSPANDPHLVWCYTASWGPWELNPLGLASELTQQPAIHPEDIFLLNRQLKDWDSGSKSWTHSRFYQRQDFVCQSSLSSCLPLFTEFIHGLWLKKSLEKAAYARRRGAWSKIWNRFDSYAVGVLLCTSLPSLFLLHSVLFPGCRGNALFSHSSVYVNAWIPVLSLLRPFSIAVIQLFL